MKLIPIKPEEVKQAKQETAKFDKQKTYDKFNCNSNYIGLLGEMVFHRYLTNKNIEHTWEEFVKKGWSKEDFNIKNVTIDLKTTYSDSMWFQRPTFDIYIYAQIMRNNKFLKVKGWTTKELLKNSISSGEADKVTRGSRVDYVISPEKLLPLNLLVGLFPPSHLTFKTTHIKNDNE